MTHRVAGVVHDGQEASDLASGSRLGQGDGASTEGRRVGRDAAEDIAALRLKLSGEVHGTKPGWSGPKNGTAVRVFRSRKSPRPSSP